MSTSINDFVERARQQAADHERRMAMDPEYRAQQERSEAEDRARAEAEKRQQERERRAQVAKRRAEKGIPEKFWPYLDAWRAGAVDGLPASVEKAHAWVERFQREAGAWAFLFLAGPPGVGKTAAACWFIDAPRVEADRFGGAPRLREGPGMFVTAEELAKASTYEGEFWNEVRGAARLVIDDLGMEQLDGKGWALANLTALLSHRHVRIPAKPIGHSGRCRSPVPARRSPGGDAAG
jgi:DNA replication protein DnaC